MDKKDSVVRLRVPAALLDRFKAHCDAEGLTVSWVLRKHMESVVAPAKASKSVSEPSPAPDPAPAPKRSFRELLEDYRRRGFAKADAKAKAMADLKAGRAVADDEDDLE